MIQLCVNAKDVHEIVAIVLMAGIIFWIVYAIITYVDEIGPIKPKNPKCLIHTDKYNGSFSIYENPILRMNLGSAYHSSASSECDTAAPANLVHAQVFALSCISYKFSEYCKSKGLKHKERDGLMKLDTYVGSALRGNWTMGSWAGDYAVGDIVARPKDNNIYHLQEGESSFVELFKISSIYELSGTFILDKTGEYFIVYRSKGGVYEVR